MIQDTDQDILTGPHFWSLCAEQTVDAAKHKISAFQDMELVSCGTIDMPANLYIVVYVYNSDFHKDIPYKATFTVNYEYYSDSDLELLRENAYKEFESLKATKIIATR